jgi:hypothetical protein
MRRRRGAQPESLTSLLDVLFILVFASLVQLAAAGEKEAAAPAAPVPDAGVAVAEGDAVDAGPPPPEGRVVLRERALSALARQLEARRAVVARIAPDGTLRALEHDGGTMALGVPLLERVPDPDIALAYLGDRSPELRVCRAIALRLGLRDLRDQLVVIAPDAPIGSLTVALVAGLRRDAARCLEEQQGVAVVVDATATAPAEEP